MPHRRSTIRFGVFEVELASGELRRNGVRVKLQEQPFQVLAALLENPGEIVTKEELQARIWKDDTFVDFDRSLATAISKIRQALGDSASQPRFIETVPKRGYRFLGDATPCTAPADAARPRSTQVAYVWAAGSVLALAAGTFLVGGLGTEEALPPPALTARPLTSSRGLETHPAISPGGERVAYVRGAVDADGDYNTDIYVLTIGSDADPIRLTTGPSWEWNPTWSPDGDYVAFLRGYPGQSEILRIPSIGGPEQELGEAFFPAPLSEFLAVSHTFLDWSPDGRFLAVALGTTQDRPSPHQLELVTGEITPLPRPGAGKIRSPAYAPDGRALAFTMEDGAGKRDVWLQELSETGKPVDGPRRLTRQENWMFGLDWTPDGREIVFVSVLDNVRRLWRVSTAGGEPETCLVSDRKRIS